MEPYVALPIIFGPFIGLGFVFWRLIEARQKVDDLSTALEVAAESLRYYRGDGDDLTSWVEGKLYVNYTGVPESPGLEAANTLTFIGEYLKAEPPVKD